MPPAPTPSVGPEDAPASVDTVVRYCLPTMRPVASVLSAGSGADAPGPVAHAASVANATAAKHVRATR